MRTIRISLYSLSILFLLFSCAYYSFKGALPSHIKTVAVPLFNDLTSYPGVREKLTNMLTDGFISDNTLQIVDEPKADIIITGTINSIIDRPATVSAGEVVTNFQVTVRVKVKCEDIKMSKVLFDKNIAHYGLMESGAGLDERDQAIEEALELITDDVINSTLGGW